MAVDSLLRNPVRIAFVHKVLIPTRNRFFEDNRRLGLVLHVGIWDVLDEMQLKLDASVPGLLTV